MSTVVLKFGGSSVADNIKLNVVAQKVIEFKQQNNDVVVVVSAQGKTTDRLIKEAHELSAIPDEREMDMLLSTGEQITISKLSILLNQKGYPTISLTGWQAGIKTNEVYQSAKVEQIYPERIREELNKGKIVVVAGFQGINEYQDITTLGRGGSDTTAVSLAAALDAEECHILSDVDGIYSADPKVISEAKKLKDISFQEMQEIADSGAKVLHNRCIHIGEKFNCNIFAESTFSNNEGTKICKEIETSEVKSIVKNTNLILIKMKKKESLSNKDVFDIYNMLLKNNVIVEVFKREEKIEFRIKKSEQNKVLELLEKSFAEYEISQSNISKLCVIGYGITQDNKILTEVMNILQENEIEIFDISLTQSKIEIILDDIDDSVVEKLHSILIN